MTLIDTHTHLETFARRGELPAILERARTADLKQLITIGTSPEDWGLYRDITRDQGGFVQYSVGLHPCAVDADWPAALAQVEAFWKVSASAGNGALGTQHGSDSTDEQDRGIRPVALGEIGLDRFHLPKDPAEAEVIFGWQREAFSGGLKIAKHLGCPVVVHSRGAFRECVEMIDASGVNWTNVVFHCFTEGEKEMDELLRRGGFGSFTGILTYKTAETIRASAKRQGLARLMIETDAPYLTPVPHRGKPNEPAFLRHTAEFAAKDVFAVSLEELSAVTSETARRFYRL